MLGFFNTRWDRVPVIFIDTETTGIDPVNDRAVQVGLARFEAGKLVKSAVQLVNPGRAIPAAATAIHGITDEKVRDMPSIGHVFAGALAREFLDGAQPAAYNAGFDRHFVPAFGDRTWPWLDALSLVRVVDRFVRGQGRHKLEAACARHGVTLRAAHDAEADAIAAGELFYRLVPTVLSEDRLGGDSLGELLRWQRSVEAEEWFRFHSWLSRQPPRPEAQP